MGRNWLSSEKTWGSEEEEKQQLDFETEMRRAKTQQKSICNRASCYLNTQQKYLLKMKMNKDIFRKDGKAFRDS